MNEMMTIFAMAITVEALVEYGKSIAAAAAGRVWKQALTQMAAVTVGVLLCLSIGADLYALLGLEFARPWLGKLLTGILISRGANYVSDMATRLSGKKEVR